VNWKALVLVLGCVPSIPVAVQSQAVPLISQSIDQEKVVTLHGNVHPLAQARYEVGTADPSLPARQLMLLLGRPADREVALSQYMRDVHNRGSAAYHHWLTPEEFGARFGAADSDIQQVSDWLSGLGFQVAGVSKSKTLIEFSGTVGQVNNAFHTQIRKYAVNGGVFYANATDPQIPEALAGIVREVSALNNFRPSSDLRVVGTGHVDPATRKIMPDFTTTAPNGTFYAIAPEDFATQYDLAPLYAAGINGSGETIGVINDSNIDVNLDNSYRSLFNLSNDPAQVVLDGGDPGINGDATEAYLDVELSGAVAPAATVNLYIASWDTVADALDDPLILAARRAIEDNRADVLSVSFSECEGDIGPADNQILAALWEQAAAQGQTVLVSTGDSGSANCDPAAFPQVAAANGLQVNGFASTPWDVAVGGTDFYYSDYASGAPSAATLWNATNDNNLGSLKAPLAEQVWNDPLGFDAMVFNDTYYLINLEAGGGGASGCINSVLLLSGGLPPFFCNPVSSATTITGYAKPSWQSGPGVPADGVRDLPDVSLFSGSGGNLSAYAICASPGDCVAGTDPQVTLVGGTSASAQAMAGIMALVDQKYGRQGQADHTLYALAQQKPSAFHDITLGGNNVPCVVDNGVLSLNCVALQGNTSYDATLSGYSAATGYDLASGLGSIDANVLVTDWNSLTFASTSTSLQLSPATFTHGTPVTLNVDVSSSSGGAAPQGGVSILTDSPLPVSQSVDFLTLDSNGSAGGSIDSLPGGTYELWADYGGDGLHSGSDSSPISVTVAPEASSMSITAYQTYSNSLYNPFVGCTPVVGTYENTVASGSSFTINTPLWLSVQPRGSTSNLATATGFVTFTLDGQPATVPLNVSGIATWITPMGVSPGLHTVVASYSGDASYGASTSAPFTYTVQPLNVLSIAPYSVGTASGAPVYGPGCYPNNQCNMLTGDNLQVEVLLGGDVCNLATGTVNVTLGSQTQAVTLTPWGYPTGQLSLGWVTFPNLQAGTYQLTGSYSGDSYFPPSSSAPYTVIVAPSTDPLLPTSTTVSVNPSTVSYENGSTTFTVTVTGSDGPPTGYVAIYANGDLLAEPGVFPSGANTSTGSAQIFQVPNMNAFGVYVGLEQIVGDYFGDSVNQGSISSPVTLNVVSTSVSPDFILAPQVNQLTVQSGSSATVAINLAPQNEFSGAVTLSCAPSTSQITCSVNPSTATLNGSATATATLTIAAAAQTTALAARKHGEWANWPVGTGMLAICLFLAGGRAHRRLRRSMLLSLCLLATMLTISCSGGVNSSGGGGGGGGGGSTAPPVLVTYSVLVTGTANGIVHNAKITVVVP
jgi:hypothetical protein